MEAIVMYIVAGLIILKWVLILTGWLARNYRIERKEDSNGCV